mgnify:CR=1 FL=1
MVMFAMRVALACNADTLGMTQVAEGSAVGGSTEPDTSQPSSLTAAETSGDTQVTGGVTSTSTTAMSVSATNTESTGAASMAGSSEGSTGTHPGVCGDGVVNQDEECDMPDETGDPREVCCDDTCRRCARVFATKNTYLPNWGGVAGAVEHCVVSAMAADMVEPAGFRPWLSDDLSSPAMVFDTSYTGVYVNSEGVVVAEGWGGLIEGMLDNPIHLDEYGDEITYSIAWTATNPDGNLAEAAPCDNFGMATNMFTATGGAPYATDAGWSNTDQFGCGDDLGLYCFEQLP